MHSNTGLKNARKQLREMHLHQTMRDKFQAWETLYCKVTFRLTVGVRAILRVSARVCTVSFFHPQIHVV